MPETQGGTERTNELYPVRIVTRGFAPVRDVPYPFSGEDGVSFYLEAEAFVGRKNPDTGRRQASKVVIYCTDQQEPLVLPRNILVEKLAARSGGTGEYLAVPPPMEDWERLGLSEEIQRIDREIDELVSGTERPFFLIPKENEELILAMIRLRQRSFLKRLVENPKRMAKYVVQD